MSIRASFVSFILIGWSCSSFAMIDAVITSSARTQRLDVSIPASISVITKQDIQDLGASHVIDVLRSIATLSIEDSFGDGSRSIISMRGFSAGTAHANTLVLVDGRRLNNTDISSPDINSISIKDINKIEITQGSAGILYGDQAVGGVINIITGGSHAVDTIDLFAGSYQQSGIRASASHEVTEGLSFRFSLEDKHSENYRRINNAVDYTNITADLDIVTEIGKVTIGLQSITEDLELPGSLLTAELIVDRRQTYVDFQDDFTDSDTLVSRIGADLQFDDHWSFEGEITSRAVDRSIQQSFRGFVVSSPSELSRRQIELTPRLIGQYATDQGTMQVTTGVDLIETEFRSGITSSSDDQTLLAVYVQLTFPISESIDMTTGLRHSVVEDDVISLNVSSSEQSDVTVGTIGVRYQPQPSFELYTRIDQNFRFAKVDELTYVSPGVSLRPQTGESYEAGIKFETEMTSSEVNLYLLDLKDEIAYDPTAPQPVGAFFPGANVNFDPTTHRGISFFTDIRLSERADINARYAYTDATFDSGVFAGRDVSGVPKHQAFLGLDYRFSARLFSSITARFVGRKYLDGDNANASDRTPGYSVVDLNVRYSLKDIYLNAQIKNLTDQRYFESANVFGSRFPLPERNVLLTLGMQF